ncbi:MAG: xanthine dehydrogenase family protein subunit M [Spirochaetaceae bacterium]|nr:MAG: xanthine dehydrogenase family protein subunit M [Spirochaetaceae bacterium]
MSALHYARPESLADAIAILEQYGPGARVLNGGTDLMVRFQKMQVTPEAIVDIKRVRDMSDAIVWDGDSVTIGARVVMTRLIRDERIRRRYPALVDAASTVGSIQIRNRATLAGNICNASPAADTVPPLLVHGATVQLVGSSGSRETPLDGFFLAPGKTARAPDELLVSITIPPHRSPYGAAFGRLTRRHGVDLASINMACAIDAERAVTFAFGAVGPTPITVKDTSGALADHTVSDAQRDAALQALIARTSPISDVRASAAYRSAMLLVIGRRVLAQAQQRRADFDARE